MKISKCPYCSKQLTFFQAFFLRSKGEYFCNKCKKESNVMIRKALILPFIIALLLSLVILFLFFVIYRKAAVRAAVCFIGYVITAFRASYKCHKIIALSEKGYKKYTLLVSMSCQGVPKYATIILLRDM